MLHHHLKNKYSWYSNWHQHKYHRHLHWLTFALAALIATVAIFSVWQANINESNQIVFYQLKVLAGENIPTILTSDIPSLRDKYKQSHHSSGTPPDDYKNCCNSGNWWDCEVGRPRKIADAIIFGDADKSEWESALRCYVDMQRELSNPSNQSMIAWARLKAGFAIDDADYVNSAVHRFTDVIRQGNTYEPMTYDWNIMDRGAEMSLHYSSKMWAEIGDYYYTFAGTKIDIKDAIGDHEIHGRTEKELMQEMTKNFSSWLTFNRHPDVLTVDKFQCKWHWYKMGDGAHDLYKVKDIVGFDSETSNLLYQMDNNLFARTGARSFPTSLYLTSHRNNFFSSANMIHFTAVQNEASNANSSLGAVNILTSNTSDRQDVSPWIHDIIGESASDGVLNQPWRLLNLVTLPDDYNLAVTNPAGAIDVKNTEWICGSASQKRDRLLEIVENWGWWGVTTLGGYYGLAAENLSNSDFTMKKAWFFFDDEIVSTGSGLSGTNLKTWLNTFRVKDNSYQSSNGSHSIPKDHNKEISGYFDSGQNLGNISWLWHDNTGYVFPHSSQVYTRLVDDAKGTDLERVDDDFAQVYLDHGSPTSGSYAAIILPNTSLSETQNHNDIQIEKLDASAHIVRDTTNGMVGAAIFEPNGGNGTINLNQPGYILFQDSGEFKLSLYNPHRETSIDIIQREDGAGFEKNPYLDSEVSSPRYIDYQITLPKSLSKSSSCSGNACDSFSVSGNSLNVSLRVYRKFEIKANSLGEIVEATIGLNDYDAGANYSVVPPPAPADPYCGDNTCDSNETCSSCEADCGVCSSTPGDNSDSDQNLNCSGVVDLYDFGILMSCWGDAYDETDPKSCYLGANVPDDCAASPDITGPAGEPDGQVDTYDLGALLSCWGTTCEGETTSAVCGNGTLESGEECDDGNTVSGDGCSNSCQVEGDTAPTCGDGTCNLGEDSDNCPHDCPKPGDPGDCTKFVSRNADGNGSGNEVDDTWTIDQAFSKAQPGDVVCFRGGVYESEGGDDNFEIEVSGNSSDRIVFTNYSSEKPIIDGGNNNIASTNGGVRIQGDYITFSGFEVRNFHYMIGVKVPGSNVIIENNYIHDNADHNGLKGGDESDYICGYGGWGADRRCGDGIFTMKETRNNIIRYNILWANGTHNVYDHNIYSQGIGHIIERNTVAFGTGCGISDREAGDLKINHNVLYHNYNCGIAINDSTDNDSPYPDEAGITSQANNNIIYGGNYPIHNYGHGDFSYNLIYNPDGWKNNDPWEGGSQPSETIESDPRFVDPPSSVDDTSYSFKLQNGSPAIDSGKDWGQDYAGSAPDRGRYEYQ